MGVFMNLSEYIDIHLHTSGWSEKSKKQYLFRERTNISFYFMGSKIRDKSVNKFN